MEFNLNSGRAMKIEVTSIGDINIDIITPKIQEMPEKDSQIIIGEISITSGGCAANFAKALGKLGLNTRLIGKLGNDTFKNFLKDELKGIDLKASMGTKTGLTYAITFKDNTRSFITYPGSNSELSIKDIDFSLIKGRHLHITSLFLQGLKANTEKILNFAHSKGMTTSLDTGWDPGGWSERDIKLVRRILKGVDIFFPNIKEGQAITGLNDKRAICDKLQEFGTKAVALKIGSKGSYIATPEKQISVPPFRVRVVDTTGAGDVFDAGFVYGHLKDWNLEKIGRFANAAAALSTTGYGSGNYPGLRDVQRLCRLR